MGYSNDAHGHIFVEVNVFYDDLKRSYFEFVEPIIQKNETYLGVTTTTIDQRLKVRTDYCAMEAIKHFPKLKSPISSTLFHTLFAGASGAMQTTLSVISMSVADNNGTAPFITNPEIEP